MASALQSFLNSFNTVPLLTHSQFYNYELLAELDITSICLISFAYEGRVNSFIVPFKTHRLDGLTAM
jgi:hypothetical protein